MARIAALLLAFAATSSAAVEEGLSLLQTNLHVHKPPTSIDVAAIVESLRDPSGQKVDENLVLATMAAAPLDPTMQASGCRQLMAAIAWKGDEICKPSVIEPVVEAIKNNVADRTVVETCIFALMAFQPAFNRTRTLALNNGTHIAEAVAAVLRHYAHDREMQADALIWVASFSTYVACETQPPFVQAGCLDLVWDALDHFTGPEYSDVQMSAWQGFSDHSACPAGANVIADHGGKNVGTRRLVKALREAIGNQFHPSFRHGGDFINLQYEILTVANGLLTNADDAFDVLVQAGYGPLVMSSMRDQPDERSTNERACTALFELSRNLTVRASLEAHGALELIAGAMERFKGPDHRIFVNAELGNFYAVLPSCDLALQNFADQSVAAQDTLLRLGVLETYDTMREDLRSAPSMSKLPAMLRARQRQVG